MLGAKSVPIHFLEKMLTSHRKETMEQFELKPLEIIVKKSCWQNLQSGSAKMFCAQQILQKWFVSFFFCDEND